MKEKRVNEIQGVIIVAAGLIVMASVISFSPFDLSFYTSHPNIPPRNLIGIFGAYLAGIIFFLFGKASYIIPMLILFVGARLFKQKKPDLRMPKLIGVLVFLVSVASLIGTLSSKWVAVGHGETVGYYSSESKFLHSGLIGFIISQFITGAFGPPGAYIIFITLIILSITLVTDILISTFFSNILKNVKPVFKFLSKLKIRPKVSEKAAFNNKMEKKGFRDFEDKVNVVEPAVKPFPAVKPNIQVKAKTESAQEAKSRPQELKIGGYVLPSLDLLDAAPAFEERQIKDNLKANAQILEETLSDFGISARVTDIERGPVITRYELEPAPGVKLNRIVNLEDDIALVMKAQSVRIVAPIPGKARVGIEVPNSQSSLVFLRDLLFSTEFQKSDSKLTLALGKDIAGHPVIADLGDMPHLLIAGTTGAGKTVCVNSLILSMLFKSSPNDLKLLMVDPKMVELAPFNGMPHLLCPVLTDAKKAAAALNWVVSEMEDRYQLLAKVGARNIDAYNKKEEKIPYIVVIIDEMADLMMTARDQIESTITRLAQLSRAVGIHLIMATQRPSVDVITGVIKANFPARISFKVASKVDSRTVLDMNGADKLLGKGDMLFLQPGEEKLTRAQGCLVKDVEIERVVNFIKAQAQPVYNEEIAKGQQKSNLSNGEKDEIYEEAVRIIIESNQASVSILQRRLRLGYTRAARIIDTMEQDGLVGPFEGSKPRKILVDREEWLRKDILPEKSK